MKYVKSMMPCLIVLWYGVSCRGMTCLDGSCAADGTPEIAVAKQEGGVNDRTVYVINLGHQKFTSIIPFEEANNSTRGLQVTASFSPGRSSPDAFLTIGLQQRLNSGQPLKIFRKINGNFLCQLLENSCNMPRDIAALIMSYNVPYGEYQLWKVIHFKGILNTREVAARFIYDQSPDRLVCLSDQPNLEAFMREHRERMYLGSSRIFLASDFSISCASGKCQAISNPTTLAGRPYVLSHNLRFILCKNGSGEAYVLDRFTGGKRWVYGVRACRSIANSGETYFQLFPDFDDYSRSTGQLVRLEGPSCFSGHVENGSSDWPLYYQQFTYQNTIVSGSIIYIGTSNLGDYGLVEVPITYCAVQEKRPRRMVLVFDAQRRLGLYAGSAPAVFWSELIKNYHSAQALKRSSKAYDTCKKQGPCQQVCKQFQNACTIL